MDIQSQVEKYVYGNVIVCELLFGQPEEFYWELVRRKTLPPINFNRYYVLISGLSRQIYRRLFGMNAIKYTNYFRETIQRIEKILSTEEVGFLATMLLYDHSKRLVFIFSAPEHCSAMDIAQVVTSHFDGLYSRIFDMDHSPYCNYTVLSEEIHGYENLTRAFNEMDALSRQQFFDMSPVIMTQQLLESSRQAIDGEQLHEELRELSFALSSRSKKEMFMLLDHIMDMISASRDFMLLDETLHTLRANVNSFLISIGKNMTDEMKNQLNYQSYPTMALMSQGIKRILENLIAENEKYPIQSELIGEASRYIRHHYAENISVKDIAFHIGMSVSWLSRRFTKEHGCSIPEFIKRIRLEQSCKLLRETNLPIKEIACSIGFVNAQYFSTLFIKAFGISPTEYRKKARVIE